MKYEMMSKNKEIISTVVLPEGQDFSLEPFGLKRFGRV